MLNTITAVEHTPAPVPPIGNIEAPLGTERQNNGEGVSSLEETFGRFGQMDQI